MQLQNVSLWLSCMWLAFCSLTLTPHAVVAFRPPSLADELGCSPTLSWLLLGGGDQRGRQQFFFDPLDIANDLNFSRLREMELKHGRVAMLAVTETILVPAMKIIHLDEWIPAIADKETGIIQSLNSHSVNDYAVLIAFCGILETTVFVQRDKQAMPGDYGTGYFGVRDKGRNERSLVSELENGRLAMIACVGQLAAELVNDGQPWYQQWIRIFATWVQEL